MKNEKVNIVIIGGGAAGFFGALRAKFLLPDAHVVIFEKSNKLLAKVKVSGGGRCNVTHHCFEISKLLKNYPRGEKDLRQAFNQFACKDTVSWFEDRGVSIKVEEDGRMFPTSNNSQSIIDCLLSEAEDLGVEIYTSTNVQKVSAIKEKIEITFDNERKEIFDAVLIATGGHPSVASYKWLSELKHQIISPLPSLFTFNLKEKNICSLMGISVHEAQAKIVGTKFVQSGPLLITHWGFSGPAILKLSAFAARELATKNYEFTVAINWLNKLEEDIRSILNTLKSQFPKRTLARSNEFNLPKRLWDFLLLKVKIDQEQVIGQLAKDSLNRLVNVLVNDQYEVRGKTTFKEEFVTCGGIDTAEIDFLTMESKLVPNVFFGGEVLNIDAITGGFNFQAAWTAGYVAGTTIGKRFSR